MIWVWLNMVYTIPFSEFINVYKRCEAAQIYFFMLISMYKLYHILFICYSFSMYLYSRWLASPLQTNVRISIGMMVDQIIISLAPHRIQLGKLNAVYIYVYTSWCEMMNENWYWERHLYIYLYTYIFAQMQICFDLFAPLYFIRRMAIYIH